MKILLIAILSVVLLETVHCEGDVGADDQNRQFAIKVLKSFNLLAGNGDDPTEFSNAVKALQKLAKLPQTGTLDDETLGYMGKSHCGSKSKGKRLNKRYKITDAKWRNMNLNYFIQNWPAKTKLGKAAAWWAIRYGLDEWTKYTPLKFQEVGSMQQADVFINFGTTQHDMFDRTKKVIVGKCNSGNSFNEPGGVLAHGYYPENGNLHFDDNEEWTEDTDEGINLRLVTLHEMGHGLGLCHSDVQGAMMFPWYSGYIPRDKFVLHSDDVAGIQAQYGRKVHKREAAVRTSDRDRRDAKSPLCQTQSINAIFDYPDGYTYIVADGVIYRRTVQGVDHSYQKKVSDIWSSSGVPSSFKAVYLPHSQELLLLSGFDVYVAKANDKSIESLQFTKKSIEGKFGYQGKPVAVFGFELHGIVHIVERDQVFDLDPSTFTLKQAGGSIGDFLNTYAGRKYLPRVSGAYVDLKSNNKVIYFFTGKSFYLAQRDSESSKYYIPADYPKHFLTEYLHC